MTCGSWAWGSTLACAPGGAHCHMRNVGAARHALPLPGIVGPTAKSRSPVLVAPRRLRACMALNVVQRGSCVPAPDVDVKLLWPSTCRRSAVAHWLALCQRHGQHRVESAARTVRSSPVRQLVTVTQRSVVARYLYALRTTRRAGIERRSRELGFVSSAAEANSEPWLRRGCVETRIKVNSQKLHSMSNTMWDCVHALA